MLQMLQNRGSIRNDVLSLCMWHGAHGQQVDWRMQAIKMPCGVYK